MQAINNKDEYLVHQHFNNNCSINNFTFFIIAVQNNKEKRLINETNFIEKFKTKNPDGLNIIANNNIRYNKLNLIIPYSKNTLLIANSIKNICQKSDINIRLCFKNNKNLTSILKNY